MGVIDQLLRMAKCKVRIRARMTEVRVGDRVTAPERTDHRRMPDCSRQSSIAESDELAVPLVADGSQTST
jgi:hypothetical protein